MKLECSDGSYGLDITLTPETPEETSQLLRYTNNARSVRPDVWLNFSDKNKGPHLSIVLKKKQKNVWNSINPFRKK